VSRPAAHLCTGPDAGQLLGFLCSLGLLEAATRSLPEYTVRVGFTWHAVAFRPELVAEPQIDRDALVELLHGWVRRRATSPELTRLGDDLPCNASEFETVARELLAGGDVASSTQLAAFGVARPGSERLDDTAFRTMSGAGHQHFLRFARQIAEQTTLEQLERSLFQAWEYEDPGPSLRFDPTDDRRYALRADDPSKASSRAPIRAVRGANALAFAGLALLPVVPAARGAATTLVFRDDGSLTVRWPLWERPLSRDAAAGLLASPAMLGAPGIAAVFEARRLTVGKFRSFTPSRRTA
jgi:hypothetical protein